MPTGEDPAEVRAAIHKERQDRSDAERGTNRNLKLLQSRRVPPLRKVKGIVGHK